MANLPSKAPTKRATPKVSPLRGMGVEEWIEAKVSTSQRPLVRRLIGIARDAAPKAALSIKWGQPVFEENGPVAFIKPAKAHVTFGFWRGGELKDPARLLEGGDVMRHCKVRTLTEIPEVELKRFMRGAVALNRTLGDPTKRKKQS